MMEADDPPAVIDILPVDPATIALVRRTVPMVDIPKAQREARILLDAAVRAAGLPADLRTVTLWRPPAGGAMDYAPGVFVSHAIAVSAPVSLFTLPAGVAAHYRMAGPFAGLPDAWGRLFAGIATQGRVSAGLNWEVYPAAGTPQEQAVTDLYALLTEQT